MNESKWMMFLLAVWLMATPGFALAPESALRELDQSFAGLNVAGRLVEAKSDTAFERFVVSLAYFAEEDGWRSLARAVRPGQWTSSYYAQVMEEVESRMERGPADPLDGFMGFAGCITLEDETWKEDQAVTMREKTFGFFAKELYVYGPWSVFGIPRAISELCELALGGMDRTEALLKGMVYASLIEVLEERMKGALLAAVDLPTGGRVKKAEEAFYAFAFALAAANENALALKLSDEEKEEIEEALKVLDAVSFDMEEFGIRHLVQLAAEGMH